MLSLVFGVIPDESHDAEHIVHALCKETVIVSVGIGCGFAGVLHLASRRVAILRKCELALHEEVDTEHARSTGHETLNFCSGLPIITEQPGFSLLREPDHGAAIPFLGMYEEAGMAYDMAIAIDPDVVKYRIDKELLLKSAPKEETPLSPLSAFLALITVLGILVRHAG